MKWISNIFQAVMIALLSGIAVAVILLAVAKAMGIDLIDAWK